MKEKIQAILIEILVFALFCGSIVVFMLALADGAGQPLFVIRQMDTLETISGNQE